MRYLFLLLFLLGLNACKKPQKVEKPYYTMDEEFRKTFLQGSKGSYWIYSDSLEKIRDTVTMIQSSKFMGQADWDDYIGEGYTARFIATNSNNYFFDMATYININANDTTLSYSYIKVDLEGSGHLTIRLIDGVYHPEGSVQKMDSILLLGKTYYNVYSVIGGSQKVIIDPEIGIIYKEAWSRRPTPGIKKFYLKEYILK